MTQWIQPEPSWDTNRLLGEILLATQDGGQVQFLTDPGCENRMVQRLRVALSRSRSRHRNRSSKVQAFTLRHSTYAYTDLSGKRFGCVVMWTERHRHHVTREILDNLLEL